MYGYKAKEIAEITERSIGTVLHPGERELEAHLGVCRHCCGELEFAHRLREMVRRPNGAGAFTADVRARLETFLKELGAASR